MTVPDRPDRITMLEPESPSPLERFFAMLPPGKRQHSRLWRLYYRLTWRLRIGKPTAHHDVHYWDEP